MNESWSNAPLKDEGAGMSKTITVRRSELGTLRNETLSKHVDR